MIWWWTFILVTALIGIIMLAAAALLAGGQDAREFPSKASVALRRRFVPILRGVSTSISVYAMPLLIEWALLRSEFNPWLVCVFLADLPGALLLYKLGYRKTAMLTYAAATLLEATLLSKGIMPREVMMLNNVAPAVAVGVAIAWRSSARSSAHRLARL